MSMRRRYDEVTTIAGNPTGNRAERRMAERLKRKKGNGTDVQPDPGPINYVKKERMPRGRPGSNR